MSALPYQRHEAHPAFQRHKTLEVMGLVYSPAPGLSVGTWANTEVMVASGIWLYSLLEEAKAEMCCSGVKQGHLGITHLSQMSRYIYLVLGVENWDN